MADETNVLENNDEVTNPTEEPVVDNEPKKETPVQEETNSEEDQKKSAAYIALRYLGITPPSL